MHIVTFDIKPDDGIQLYEVRAYWNRGPDFETINFTNGMGSRALAPGIYDVSVLMWGKTGSGVELAINTGDDEYELSGKIYKGSTDVFTYQIIVGSIAAFGVSLEGEVA